MSTFAKKIEAYLLSKEPLIILFFLVILLRIPNLLEPYWYGDEGIYLTIGHALRQGFTLYKDIVDHKTPVLYFLAMTPSLFWFKALLMGWSIIMVGQVYEVAKKLFSSTRKAFVVATTFLLLTTLPTFEGNIANGELFVLGFITTALWILAKSHFFTTLINPTANLPVNPKPMFFIGLFLGVAVLTKVPAIMDCAAFGAMLFFCWLEMPTRARSRALLLNGLWIAGGFVLPILISIAYFASQQALKEYWELALVYNFQYSKEFGFPFQSDILRWLFSMPGKLASLSFVAILSIGLVKRSALLPRVFFLWFFCTLFATLLSSRPYPHYWLQTALPLSFLFGYALFAKQLERIFFFSSLGVIVAVLLLFQVAPYPTFRYYSRFGAYVSNQISKEEYIQSFDPLMRDTYDAADQIQRTTQSTDRIFIWGTNPMLYALSRRMPAGRFTVSFHIKDFQAYAETIRDIERTTPEAIIVMKNENEVFPELNLYLERYYVPAKTYDTMHVFRKLKSPSIPNEK